MFHGCGALDDASCNNKHHSVCIFFSSIHFFFIHFGSSLNNVCDCVCILQLFCHFPLLNACECVWVCVCFVYTIRFCLICAFLCTFRSLYQTCTLLNIQIAGITSLHWKQTKKETKTKSNKAFGCVYICICACVWGVCVFRFMHGV